MHKNVGLFFKVLFGLAFGKNFQKIIEDIVCLFITINIIYSSIDLNTHIRIVFIAEKLKTWLAKTQETLNQ